VVGTFAQKTVPLDDDMTDLQRKTAVDILVGVSYYDGSADALVYIDRKKPCSGNVIIGHELAKRDHARYVADTDLSFRKSVPER
jgi:hypothetical protein